MDTIFLPGKSVGREKTAPAGAVFSLLFPLPKTAGNSLPGTIPAVYACPRPSADTGVYLSDLYFDMSVA